MSMRKTILVTALAAAISTSAISVVSASAVTTTIETQQYSLFVNDAATTVRTVTVNGVPLVSVRDLGTAVGALFVINPAGGVTAYFQDHAIDLKASSKQAIVDGTSVDLQAAVEAVNQSYYIKLEDFVQALGVDTSVDDAGKVWVDAVQKIQADQASWIDAGHLLASQVTEDGRVDYVVDAATGSYKQLLNSTEASGLTIAPNGSKAAYTVQDGAVYVVDLAKGNSAEVTTDNTIKPELVWSADSSSIYFLQGDKGSVIAKLNPADGTITKVLDDKVDYKSNLSVSADGKSFIYTVIKPGAVTADASKPVDSDDVAIDMTGTEPHFYSYDSSVKDGKPVKLTATADDKIYVGATADAGKAIYVSVEDSRPSSLIAVAKDKTVTKLIDDKDVLQAVVAGDIAFALVDGASEEEIYEVNLTSGAKKLVANVPADVTEIIAAPGTPLAIVQNGQVLVNHDGTWKKVTKS
ncbi:stalk domain-containing protein [Paenibacillus solisilvae]|uniref:Stalk domain-containing protein n=1 Tax=Paenibacillus solisilvae TaxID=2486751 RepID=A0ABW0VTA3_9BACL